MPDAPTTEVGHGRNGLMPWGGYIDTEEPVTELAWPNSLIVYESMRHDAQLSGILRAATLPIRRYRWSIDPNGARDEVVEHIARDMNLPIHGIEQDNRGRTGRRFDHDEHLRHVFLALPFGFMFFEITGTIADDNLWHMRKLAPRMPKTISRIEVEDDGGLRGIRQHGTARKKPSGGIVSSISSAGTESPLIPVDHLAAYVPDREGGNWVGQSIFRDCYKNWLVKDRLMRVDAIKHERNGMGIPEVTAPENATPQQVEYAHALASKVRAGELSGAGLPHGFKLRFVGTEGTLPDTIASIRYHDQQMARVMLEMFMELGTTETGSRALGGAFIDFFSMSQEAMADWYVTTTNAHVIEKNVDWNWGEDEQAPRIRYDRSPDPGLAVADLVSLIDSGAVVVDEETEDWIRHRYSMPSVPDDRPAPIIPPGGTPPTPPAATQRPPRRPLRSGGRPRARLGDRIERRLRGGRVDAAEDDSEDDWVVPLPPRKLRRQPYAHEVAARTDFAAIEEAVERATDDVVERYKAEVRGDQIAELLDQIEAAVDAEDLAALGTVAATPIGTELLEDAMLAAAQDAAELAVQEAAEQGITIAMPDIDRDAIAARAAATDALMARSISEAAGRRALAVTAPGMSGADVAAAVEEYLNGLTDTYLTDTMGGAMMGAANTGRRAVMADQPGRFYASELLDTNTCGPCRQVDGTEYDSIEDSEDDYPSGGYKGCLGGPRCRGTLVAVFDEAEASI